MNDLCLDCETTTFNKGNPFDSRNQLVCIALCGGGQSWCLAPTNENLAFCQTQIDNATRLVGFNLKFDLHWLRRVGLNFSEKRVYDVQAAEFVLSGQTHKFPSLNDVGQKYLGRTKIDEVKAFWDQGVQTTDIPWEILERYAIEDVDLTLSVARKQEADTPNSLKRLISLVNQDLLVLEEMEWNGIKFDREKSLKKAEELETKISELQRKHDIHTNVPNFNWGSNHHLSALLYGGTIDETIKVPVGHFKSGKQKGEIKFKNETRQHHLPRIYQPPKGSETATPGVFGVGEEILSQLKGKNKELLTDLLEMKKLQKENSTYLLGFPKRQDEGHYKDYIYGNFNQCVAATGRLSSTAP